jgi:hypothetical protein
MGNQLFLDVNAILGHKTEPYLPFWSSYEGFDPSSVSNTIPDSCVDAFQEDEVSNLPARLSAFFSIATFDANNVDFPSVVYNVCESSGSTLRCDWEKLYKGIIRECKVLNARGFAQGDFMNYYEGDCEELLGISDSIIEDNKLNPEDEWCQAYYGEQGTPAFATIAIDMEIDSMIDDYDILDVGSINVANRTIGLEAQAQQILIENVPYCTGLTSCTDQEFFTLLQAEASGYSNYYEANSFVQSYNIQINPDVMGSEVCVDSRLKMKAGNKDKGCKFIGKNPGKRCNKVSTQKHCPAACNECDAFACVDSPRNFKLDGVYRKCNWVGQDPVARCGVKVSSVCRSTCGFCE